MVRLGKGRIAETSALSWIRISISDGLASIVVKSKHEYNMANANSYRQHL